MLDDGLTRRWGVTCPRRRTIRRRPARRGWRRRCGTACWAGGKRLRPVLCLMAAEACGADPSAALPAACALEMVHTYSLIHDDLPAMDDDDLRRGRPTCHKAFDEATAILAGDGLLTLAFEVVARHVRPAEAAAGCVRALAEAAGPAGMVGGQMADLQAEGRRDGTRRGARGDPPPQDGGPAPRRAADGGDRRRRRRGAVGRARRLRAGGRPGVPDRRRPARRPGGRGQAGQAGRQGFRVGEVDVSRFLGDRGSRAGGPGNWPTRRSRRWRRWGRAAIGCGPWPWIFWKGIADEQHDVAQDRVAGRPEARSPRRSSNSSPGRCAHELIGVVGRRSAHFASNLGVVELCLALHLTFDFARDRLIWDTGHQIYPHKLITGRAAELHTIRTRGGLMGYPNPAESPFDLFMTGHAGCAPRRRWA